MEKLSVDTSLQLWQRLYDESLIVRDSDTGHVIKRDAWERIDFILDTMLEHNEFDWQGDGQ